MCRYILVPASHSMQATTLIRGAEESEWDYHRQKGSKKAGSTTGSEQFSFFLWVLKHIVTQISTFCTMHKKPYLLLLHVASRKRKKG
jgi:hypothetical protein